MTIVPVENLRPGDGLSCPALNETLRLTESPRHADVSLGGLSGGPQRRAPSWAPVLTLEGGLQ